MSDNLVLQRLRAIRADIAELRTEQSEQCGRMGAMERGFAHLAGNVLHLEQEIAELRVESGGRFDRVLDRLDRIETRLGLADAD